MWLSEASDVLPMAVWGLWGPWSECSKRKYCQEGQQHRRRVCLSLEESAQCMGVSMEARDCPAAACVHACKFGWSSLLRWGPETIFVSDELAVVSAIIVLYVLLADSSPPILVDKSPAPATSFLAQECNATVKYAASGRFGDLVPSAVYRLYPSAKKMFKSGFFALERIPKVLKHESDITKVQNDVR